MSDKSQDQLQQEQEEQVNEPNLDIDVSDIDDPVVSGPEQQVQEEEVPEQEEEQEQEEVQEQEEEVPEQEEEQEQKEVQEQGGQEGEQEGQEGEQEGEQEQEGEEEESPTKSGLTIDVSKHYFILTSTGSDRSGCGLSMAFMNSMRRAMLLYIENYQFIEYLDMADYSLLSEVIGIPHLTQGRERHTVISNNTPCSIPALAHRCSRMPIFNDAQTSAMLASTDTRKVYFCLCADPTSETINDPTRFGKPRYNATNRAMFLGFRDLEPAVFTNESGKFTYNAAESQRLKNHINDIFPFNVKPLVILGLHEQCNIILKPTRGRGIDNCRWSPCTFNYRFNMDPRWRNQKLKDAVTSFSGASEMTQSAKPDELVPGPIGTFEGRANTLTRKVKGMMGHKDYFITSPITKQPYDKFGTPYSITLGFKYNGRYGTREAAIAALDVLREGVATFMRHYTEPISQDDLDENSLIVIHQEQQEDTQILYIPRNTDGNIQEQHPECMILTDDTLANLLVTKVQEILDRIIGGNLEWWSRAVVSYKIPHNLITQCLLFIQLPLRNADGSLNKGFTDRFAATYGTELETKSYHQIIVEAACRETMSDLDLIRGRIVAA